MKVILHTNPKLAIADEGKKLKDKNDNGEVMEDGTVIGSNLSDVVFLGSQITSVEEVEQLYEEVEG